MVQKEDNRISVPVALLEAIVQGDQVQLVRAMLLIESLLAGDYFASLSPLMTSMQC